MIRWFISSLSFGPRARDRSGFFFLLDECVCRSWSPRAAGLLGRSSGAGRCAEVFASVACLPPGSAPGCSRSTVPLPAARPCWHPRGVGCIPAWMGARAPRSSLSGWGAEAGCRAVTFQVGGTGRAGRKPVAPPGSGCCMGDLLWVSLIVVADPPPPPPKASSQGVFKALEALLPQ